jgi:hypothetical protein
MLNKFCFIFFATHIASAYSMELDCHEKARDLGGKFVVIGASNVRFAQSKATN